VRYDFDQDNLEPDNQPSDFLFYAYGDMGKDKDRVPESQNNSMNLTNKKSPVDPGTRPSHDEGSLGDGTPTTDGATHVRASTNSAVPAMFPFKRPEDNDENGQVPGPDHRDTKSPAAISSTPSGTKRKRKDGESSLPEHLGRFHYDGTAEQNASMLKGCCTSLFCT
jgi:hypothetical protein